MPQQAPLPLHILYNLRTPPPLPIRDQGPHHQDQRLPPRALPLLGHDFQKLQHLLDLVVPGVALDEAVVEDVVHFGRLA